MIDQVIVGLYLIVTLVIGLYAGRNVKSMKDFAIGSRSFSTLILVCAIFATVVDASDTIGLAENTFLAGPVFLFSYMGMIVSRFLTAYLIAPRMEPFFDLISSGDILESLFGRRAKTLMGISTLIETTLLAGVQILAIAHLSEYFFNISSEFAAFFASLFIIFYSFRGGIKSVTATDVFQFGILIIAIPLVCAVGLIKIGGHQALISTITIKGLSFIPDINYQYHLAIFVSFALPCLYPLCLQRMLMAKDTKQIKAAFITNGLLSIPFQIVVGTIGIIAVTLLPNIPAYHAFPALIDEVAPIGLKGLIIAGLLAVIMSTVDSILNTGAIAGTNDLIGSLLRSPIEEKTNLNLAKLLSVFIALGATVIAIRFNNILDILFLVLVFGNSIYFPGYFLGIFGVHGSPKAFWIGVITATFVLITGIYIFDCFILNVMLCGVCSNTSIHLIDRLLHSTKNTNAWQKKISFSINKKTLHTFFRYLSSKHWVRNEDYCSIFAICSIGFSLFSFFGPNNIKLYNSYPAFLIINTITACLSFLLIFKELWNNNLLKYFPLIWIVLITFSLPLQTAFMLGTNFSIIWVVDAFAIIPLLAVLTSRTGLLYSYLSGIILALLMVAILPPNSLEQDNIGPYALFAHIILLTICLTLFRKKDVELCRSTSSTLVHEANRSLSTFETVASYYGELLPSIISAYQEYVPIEKRTVPNYEINEILSLPADLKQMSSRTRNALTKLLNRVILYASTTESKEICLINDCIKSAILEPCFIEKRSLIELHEKDSLEVIGDRDQLIQIFINLIENSLYALRNQTLPKIEIIINNNCVSIKDNGEGIPQKIIPNIFDEKFSTKPNGGQGLYYCKKILKEHGALISCQSQKNSHTQFDIFFSKEATLHEHASSDFSH